MLQIKAALLSGTHEYFARQTIKQEMMEKDNAQVYEWNIETEIGVFTGSSFNIEDVNNEIAILKNNARIIKMNINIMSLNTQHLKKKIYTWNVSTNHGKASGVSTSLDEAKRVVSSFDGAELIQCNIVETLALAN